MTEYEAGKCNIDSREQRKRYFLGASGFTTAGIMIILTYFNYTQLYSRNLVPVLIFIGFNGFIQGRLNFCAGYGFLGKENTSGATPEDTPDDSRRKDLLGAVRIQLYASFGTVLVMGLLEMFIL